MIAIGAAVVCFSLSTGSAPVPSHVTDVTVSGKATVQQRAAHGWVFRSRGTLKLVASLNTTTGRVRMLDGRRRTVCFYS